MVMELVLYASKQPVSQAGAVRDSVPIAACHVKTFESASHTPVGLTPCLPVEAKHTLIRAETAEWVRAAKNNAAAAGVAQAMRHRELDLPWRSS
jgi:hypothetical protein